MSALLSLGEAGELAAQRVALLGQSLVAAGLETPPPPPEVPVPAASSLPAPPRSIPHEELIDAIVCAIADASDVAPKVVRPTVLVTVRRASRSGWISTPTLLASATRA